MKKRFKFILFIYDKEDSNILARKIEQIMIAPMQEICSTICDYESRLQRNERLLVKDLENNRVIADF